MVEVYMSLLIRIYSNTDTILHNIQLMINPMNCASLLGITLDNKPEC